MGQLVIADGVYRTAPRRISLAARKFPTFEFYRRFFRIVWRAGAMAKRSRYGNQEWSDSSLAVLNALEAVGVQVEVTGLEHLQLLETPFVGAGNHMSTLETAVLPGLIQPIRDVTFVVKQSLLEYPVFKYVMRSRNPIALTQNNPRQDLKTVLEQGGDRLRNGISVIVFPEGRRRSAFDAADFNTIGVKLAHREGVPVVPIALETSAWSLGRRVPDLGRIYPSRKVRFAFGEPMVIRGRGTEEHRAIVDFISGKLRTWEEEDGAAGGPVAAIADRTH